MSDNTPHPRKWLALSFPLLVLSAGVGLSMVIALAVGNLEQDLRQARLEAEFLTSANENVAAVRIGLRNGLAMTESLSALFVASDEVTQDEFDRFASHLAAQHAAVRALFWAHREPAGVNHWLPAYIYPAGSAARTLIGQVLAAPPVKPLVTVSTQSGTRRWSGILRTPDLQRDLLLAVNPLQNKDAGRSNGARQAGFVGVVYDLQRLLHRGGLSGPPNRLSPRRLAMTARLPQPQILGWSANERRKRK